MKRILLLCSLLQLSLAGISKPIDSLLVEYGGGITGQITEYKFIKNTIYKNSYRLIKAGQSQRAVVSSKKMKTVYKKANLVFQGHQGFEKPGNMFKSVIIYSKDKKVEYKWGDPSFDPPAEVKDLYDQISNFIKELTFQ